MKFITYIAIGFLFALLAHKSGFGPRFWFEPERRPN